MNTLKILAIGISYLVLFNNFDNDVFFKGLIIFMVGLLYDYIQIINTEYSKHHTLQKVIGYAGSILSFILLLLGFAGAVKYINFRIIKDVSGEWIIRSPDNFYPFSFSLDIHIVAYTVLALYILAWIENYNRCKRCIYRADHEKSKTVNTSGQGTNLQT